MYTLSKVIVLKLVDEALFQETAQKRETRQTGLGACFQYVHNGIVHSYLQGELMSSCNSGDNQSPFFYHVLCISKPARFLASLLLICVL